MTWILPLLVAGPLLAAGVLVARPLPRPVRQAVLLAVLAAMAVASGVLLWRAASGEVLQVRVGGWEQAVAISLVVDALSALMLVLTSVVTLVSVVFGVRVGAAEEPFFAPLVLVLASGVAGALMTADLFTLFVCIEVMLLPSYGLMVMAHRGRGLRMQVSATRIYVAVNLLTSSILLMGIALLYSAWGQVGFAGLLGRGAQGGVALAGSAVVLFALSTKAAVVPMHGWIGRTYPNMSPTLSALFSGLHTKVAVYALFRLHSVLFGGHPQWQTLALVLFSTSMAVGVLAAIGESDARGVLALHMVSQIGYILLGLALHSPAAIAAALFYLVHNVVAKASLFLSIGAVETAYGRHPLGTVWGLLRRERLTALVFFVAAMSLAGLPPTSGFVAKLALIGAAFRQGSWAVGAAALVVSVFTLMSMLKIWDYMFLQPAEDGASVEARIGWSLVAPAAVLALASLCLGLWGQPLLHVCDLAARQLLDPSAQFGGVR